MKSLVEAVAIILLFFITPMIAAGVLISLARVIENIGDLPIDERKPLAVRHWAGGCSFKRSHSCASRTTNVTAVRVSTLMAETAIYSRKIIFRMGNKLPSG